MHSIKDKHVYFMGIGGIGMSGIAEILLDWGCHISGSDIKTSNVTERLQRKGAIVHIGQKAFPANSSIRAIIEEVVVFP